MKMHLYQCLILAVLPYFATAACDVDDCNIGASTGLAVGCSVVGVTVGAYACGVGAFFTFGASCLAGLVAAIVIEGGCSAADTAIGKGKEIKHILS